MIGFRGLLELLLGWLPYATPADVPACISLTVAPFAAVALSAAPVTVVVFSDAALTAITFDTEVCT